MPLILIIVGVIAALAVGFVYTQNQSEGEIEIETPSIRVEETAPVTTPETPTINTETATVATPPPQDTTAETALVYKNGTYGAETSYVAPSRSNHTVTTSIILDGDVITGATVTFSGETHPASTNWQNKFTAALETTVVGKKLSEVSASRIGGASLTTNAFNEALAEIKASAQS